MSESQQPPRAPSGRPLILLVSLGIIASGIVTALLWPSEEPPDERSAQIETEQPEVAEWAPKERLVLPEEVPVVIADAAAAEPPPSPEAETVDLFAGASTELIWRAHDILKGGRRLHSKRVKQLYEYGKSHPGDARPHILLALDSMNRGWYAFAVGHYRKAAQENPEAAKDPRMLPDLIKVAGRRYDSERAHEAIAEIYGPDAVPAIRAEIENAYDQGREAEAARLEQLVESLEEPEAP